MSTIIQVSKFGSSVSCKQSKFQKKIHSKWKVWMLNFEEKVSADAEDSQVYAYGIVLFTIYRYFTCFEAVNLRPLEQTFTVQ